MCGVSVGVVVGVFRRVLACVRAHACVCACLYMRACAFVRACMCERTSDPPNHNADDNTCRHTPGQAVTIYVSAANDIYVCLPRVTHPYNLNEPKLNIT